MTALSMNAGTTDRDVFRSVVPNSVSMMATRAASAIDQAASRSGEWALEHLLGAAGGMALALTPFSFLAWMFIAR
ncbi:hypothetical protein [Lichenicoccus sp.]|uniref:hypothetical protein n=1 Tax=Lichenicoccus sp. TaxID=2781899 RepID=UPI003D0A5CBB